MIKRKILYAVILLFVVSVFIQPVAADYCYSKNDATDYNFYDVNTASHYSLEGASYDTGVLKAKGANGYWDGTYTVYEEVGLTFQPSENGYVKVAAVWEADYHIWTSGFPWRHGIASITVEYVLYRGVTYLESEEVFSRTSDIGDQSISGSNSYDTSTYFQLSTYLSSSLSYTIAVRLEFSMSSTCNIEGVTSGTAASIDVDYIYAWRGIDNP
ncbi:MAG: hypothetical protein ACTSW8_02985 [Candidatus Thorarchaeota archaeon]